MAGNNLTTACQFHYYLIAIQDILSFDFLVWKNISLRFWFAAYTSVAVVRASSLIFIINFNFLRPTPQCTRWTVTVCFVCLLNANQCVIILLFHFYSRLNSLTTLHTFPKAALDSTANQQINHRTNLINKSKSFACWDFRWITQYSVL